jgi:hypothetical protein
MGEVLVKPAREAVWGNCQHDLVDGFVGQRCLDGVHGVVTHRDGPDHIRMGRFPDLRQNAMQSLFGLGGFVVTFGVQEMHFCSRGVEDDQTELHVVVLAAAYKSVHQARGRFGVVGDDQDSTVPSVAHDDSFVGGEVEAGDLVAGQRLLGRRRCPP